VFGEHGLSASFVNLLPGDPAPWFHVPSTTSPRYAFDTAAGRFIVLCFFGTAGDEAGKKALRAITDQRGLFDDDRISLFGVTLDRADQGRVKENIPGIRFFLDFNGAVSRAYGAAPREISADGKVALRRFWIVLDPTLRVLKVFPFLDGGTEQDALFVYLRALPRVDMFAGVPLQAPVLYLPNVFELEFCQKLIETYERHGGKESGFMREVAGKTVGVNDHNHKVRRDHNLIDEALIQAAQARIKRRIVPEIAKVHQFHVSRMERNMVGCYTAEEGGHFRAHRDNTTKGTAHRRFAVSINLNADFEGGEVSFPEYGPRSFKPPPGAAVVFSCSLLHAVSKVTRGQRYAFLPFLYDDAAAKLRQENLSFLDSPTPENQRI
jgi:predicted 2-oxoglutarate/Fe(II)-dependent dioxygenase YbiX/peroxiredoxin